MIKNDDDEIRELGIAFASHLLRYCDTVLPIELLNHDEIALAHVQRHNEMEQWTEVQELRDEMDETKETLKNL